MNPTVDTLIQLFLRWAHVVAGILWLGHLYFFNFVNAPFQAKIDGATKRAVNPELQPRALFWFRWGAAWTWFTGILLAGLIYYHGRQAFEQDYQQAQNPWLWLAVVLVAMAAGFVVYNAIMKAMPNKTAGAAICLVLLAAVYLFLEHVGKFGGRSLYIHTGALFGTIMALNVWMVIWPKQQLILRATKEGNPLPADSPEVKMAGLRSRHNTYMSIPLVFFMISNHYPTMFSNPARDLCAAGVIVLGFFVTWLIYRKAGTVAGF